ncbi:hypothetical protein S40288_04052 [Stachybotrys chartarum IBT 40288]|nr:hypothetical protein S40288_04052 [Stachybotrys chartarum IBT 40288]
MTGLALTLALVAGLLGAFPTHGAPIDNQIASSALRLGANNAFKIAIMSDLHFGEEEHGWGIEQDLKTARAMRSVLDYEKPNLVVLNGDLISGEYTFRENSSMYIHQIVAPMVEKGISWASTYGNHDSAFNLSREVLFAQESTYDLCRTKVMDSALPGTTNYWIQVDGEDGSARAVLWFLDSRGGNPYQFQPGEPRDIDNWVAPETVKWMRDESAALGQANGKDVPSFVFTHIPPYAYSVKQKSGIDPSRFPGLHVDNPLAYQGRGTEDSNLVLALQELPNMHSVYVGHNHGDSYCSTWPASSAGLSRPFLCFAKHTGYGGYGNWRPGARIVEVADVDGGLEVNTWVRMESGVVITRVSLNGTYGEDVYPVETGEEFHGK